MKEDIFHHTGKRKPVVGATPTSRLKAINRDVGVAPTCFLNGFNFLMIEPSSHILYRVSPTRAKWREFPPPSYN